MFSLKRRKSIVTAVPTDLGACSTELSELLSKKLEPTSLAVSVQLMESTHFQLEFEVALRDSELELCSGFVSALGTVHFYRRISSEEKQSLKRLVSVNQLAKVKRWIRRYLEELVILQKEGVSL